MTPAERLTRAMTTVLAVLHRSRTTAEIVARTGLSTYMTRKALKALMAEGAVRQATRWYGRLSYSFVYIRNR